MISDCPTLIAQSVQKTIENPKTQEAVKEMVSQAASASSSIPFSPEWQETPFDEQGGSSNLTVYPKISFHSKKFYRNPNYQAVLLFDIVKKDPAMPIEGFIDSFVAEHIRPQHPQIVVTNMDPVTIKTLAIQLSIRLICTY